MNKTERGNLDLIIARLPGLKAKQRAALCQAFCSEDSFVKLPYDDIINAAGRQYRFDFGAAPWNIEKFRRQAERDKALMDARNIGYVSIADAAYPSLLREIYDPPAVLFYRGIFPDGKESLAIVGTRKPCAAALEFTYRIAQDLAAAGVPVVSGLALGIDAMAHRGNLDGGGKTIAVLGSGVDEIYPSSNRRLAARVLDGGGALLSEYPPGTPPSKWRFPERNRIISGLCPAVLVVSAPAKSGALITANFALEQDRDLWVAAGTDVFGDGCRRLAEDGALKIYDAKDVFREWNIETAVSSAAPVSLADALAQELGIV
ncbi:MAG: DNA-processing protein DprA [Spirochaetaceae bacterium]|nr:DNA-processing protein DprA [Spirochaetaceae bacterium]